MMALACDARAKFISRKARRGFTLIEVMVASALLGVVGTAMLAFLSAFTTGAASRARVSDPAIEATLAIRRLAALVPSMRAVVQVNDDACAIWLGDEVPSNTVHLSELGCVRYCRETNELVLERVNRDGFLADRSLETEFAFDDDLLASMAHLRDEGALSSALLCEGINNTIFMRNEKTGVVEMILEAHGASARMRLSPAQTQEPLR